MSRVVVIGGGVAGLATAALLARDGHDVDLFERRAELGGRAGSWERDGFRFDTGPSWYLMPEVWEHFFRLLGTSTAEQLELVRLDPAYRVIVEGDPEPFDVPADPVETLERFEAIEPGSAERVAKYLDDARELARLATGRFLYTTFEDVRPVVAGGLLARAPRLARLLLEPLGGLVDRTVRDERLRRILGYPAVFLGASPRLAPSLFSLMSHYDLVDGVRYPVGGFARVVERFAELARREGARLRTGVEVRRILVERGAATGVETVDADGRVGFADADVVVSTADLHHTETTLLQLPGSRSYPERYWADKVPGPSALLLLLGVEGELPELEHHTLVFASDWDANFDAIFGPSPRLPEAPSFYVCRPSGVDPSVAPEGAENLFVLVPVPADPGLGAGGVGGAGDPALESYADAVIDRLSALAGIPELRGRIVVRRTVGPADFAREFHAWRGTALGLAHTLRQSALFRPGNASRRVRGLFYAGASTIPGIGLPMCLISAELVVKRLRGDTGAGPLPEPLAPGRRLALRPQDVAESR